MTRDQQIEGASMALLAFVEVIFEELDIEPEATTVRVRTSGAVLAEVSLADVMRNLTNALALPQAEQ